jgi:hypothetical protein
LLSFPPFFLFPENVTHSIAGGSFNGVSMLCVVCWWSLHSANMKNNIIILCKVPRKTTLVPALELLPLNYRITICTVFNTIYPLYAYYSFTLLWEKRKTMKTRSTLNRYTTFEGPLCITWPCHFPFIGQFLL